MKLKVDRLNSGVRQRHKQPIALYLRVLFLLILSVNAFAQPAPLTLIPPNSRFAAPNDFVTLVFRAESGDEALSVEAEARSSLGWQILRQPGELVLEPNQSRPIALTLAVPANASAFAENIVTLELRRGNDEVSAQTEITVSERLSLGLEAPEGVVLGDEGFSVTLINQGNVTSAVRLELRRGNDVITVRERELAPQERRAERLEVKSEGRYTLVLTSGEQEVRETVSVTRFGVPPPQPFRLVADASASLSTEGWGGELYVNGPLSDFVGLTARLDPKDPLSSYVTLSHSAWTVQVGGGGNDPYGLGLTAGTGASSSYEAPRWSVAGALGGIVRGLRGDSEELSGYAAGIYRAQGARLAGGLDVRSGKVHFSARGDANVELGAFSVEAEASYDTFLDASVEAKRQLPRGNVQGRLKAQLLTEEAGLGGRLDYYGVSEHLYASGSIPLGGASRGEGWRIGLQDRLVLDDLLTLPGNFSLALEVGSERSFAQLNYGADLSDEWQADAQFGVVYGGSELGLDASTRFLQSGENYYSLSGDFTYYPRSTRLEGQVDLKAQKTYAPLTLFGNGTWDLTERRLGLNAGTLWYRGPWRVNLTGNANYAYGDGVDDPFAFGLTLSSDVSLDVDVPQAVSDLSGGRRVGVIQGVVRSDTGPLAGTEVKVGRFRLLTDEAGRYRAEVAPGTYRVSLNAASLPITYRLIGDNTVFAEVALKEEVVQDFRLARTAAIKGRVLEDANADGVADTPARGLESRLLLIDTEGLYRSLSTDAQGNFSARGLLPGAATLQLVSYPLGSTILGDAARALSLEAGEVAEVTFLLQSARTRARSFGGAALRVRRVTPSAERAPPGTAPLIRVNVQGNAEVVNVATSAGSSDLSFVEGTWLGRVPVPVDTPPGVYTFEVTARRGDETTSRRGRLVIDAAVPPLEVTADGPVRAGESLDLSAAPLFEATEVSAQSAFGDVLLTEVEPGYYTAALPVAADTEDAVYDVLFRAVREDGTVLEQTRRVRVLNTP